MQILGQIPKVPFVVACSGGQDSMVLVDFLSRYPQNKFSLVFFNHGTSDCVQAQDFLTSFCYENKIGLEIGNITREKLKTESVEEYWRNQRYEFFNKFTCPIIMAHHLDDCVESWVMSSLKGGRSLLIPYRRSNIIRPFLLVKKQEIENWALRNEVEYINDKSNLDTKHLRNYVRHVMMPQILHVNPGIHTMLRKKILKEFNKVEV